MWRRLIPCLALLPLAACVTDPYGYPSYGAPAPAYGYPGPAPYAYSDGYPTMVYGGETVFLIQGGGGWGFYDRERHWHEAPSHVAQRLHEAHPHGLPPRAEHQGWGGGQPPRPEHQGWGGGQPPRPEHQGWGGGQPAAQQSGYRPPPAAAMPQQQPRQPAYQQPQQQQQHQERRECDQRHPC